MHLQPFEFLLHEKMGLDCQTLGSHVVLRFVQQRMAELEIDSSNDYLNLCHTNPDELKLLVSSATVQETWFFRDKGSLPALHAALLKLTASSFAPRILSFPCSTGEEPFSIVMGLDLLGFDISSLRVDAWDINPRAIDAANASLYGKNSFRGSDLGYRSRYFSEEENHFRLSSSIREKAHFRLANATELPAADFRSCFHAVFCRNLLIYLSPASQDRVLRNLLFMLHPEGILFVGSSETSIPLNYGLYPVPEKM
ncbi:MAG: methyltransferase, partial [Verrucomicrobiales bacterium]|nr:methyltransferase [Verrucomicrobiales bacterium]